MDSLSRRAPTAPETREDFTTPAPATGRDYEAATPEQRREWGREPGAAQPVADSALTYVGIREQGDNAGPQVEEWQQRLGHGPGTEWCGHFASAMLDAAGARIPTVRSAWAVDFAYKAPAAVRAGDMRHAPPPGWLAVYDHERGGGHVDVVRDTSRWPRYVGTVGGNTSGPDCRTCGVFTASRSMAPGSRMTPDFFTPSICPSP
jgi:hypothetical protein